MTHELPKLPYALDALRPHISKETIEYHYGKHHKAYIDKLNELIIGTEYVDMPLEQIVREAEPGAIFNNAAQAWNHKFYFCGFSPKPKGKPEGALAEAIDRDLGGFDAMKEAMSKAGAGQFGSGWAWLVKDKDGKLEVVATPNAGNPMTDGFTPLLTIDVWEHAYYIDYRNRRPDYLKQVWCVIDWAVIEKRFAETKHGR